LKIKAISETLLLFISINPTSNLISFIFSIKYSFSSWSINEEWKSSLFLTTAGEFKVVDGAPAGIGSTSYPKPLDNAMKLADFDFQPYVRNIKDDTKFCFEY